MIVAVTGGTGFIGRRLVKSLAIAGHDVRVLTRMDLAANSAQVGVTYVRGDLCGEASLEAFLTGADVLFHCAGEISDPSRMEELHVEGTRRLINAAASRVRRWVQLSSTGAYGPHRAGEVTENDVLNPVGRYETTKVASDALVSSAAAQGAFASVILRPSIVFGAGMPNQSLYAMLRMIEKGLFFFIGRPGASANYIHVDNVVQALLDCGFLPQAAGKVFNLSDHCTMERFVQLMSESLGVAVPTQRLPEKPVRLLAGLFENVPGWPLKLSRVDALTSFVSFPISQIECELGYRHRLTMAEGIADLVRDYRERTQ